MPLRFPEPPPNFRAAFASGLAGLATDYKAHDSDHPMGGGFAPDRTEMPHEVFSLSLAGLKAGGLVSADTQGWRVFLEAFPPVRVAEVAMTPDRKDLLFLGIAAGPQIDYTKLLLGRLALDSRLELTFTVRLFRMRPLNVSAIWLSASDPARDIFIPLPPAFAPLVAGTRYQRDEFESLLEVSANKRKPSRKTLFAE